MSIQQLEHDLSALKELRSSRGWALIAEHLREGIMATAVGFASRTDMAKGEIDFRRGMIHTQDALLKLPDILVTQTENTLLLLLSQESIKAHDQETATIDDLNQART